MQLISPRPVFPYVESEQQIRPIVTDEFRFPLVRFQNTQQYDLISLQLDPESSLTRISSSKKKEILLLMTWTMLTKEIRSQRQPAMQHRKSGITKARRRLEGCFAPLMSMSSWNNCRPRPNLRRWRIRTLLEAFGITFALNAS